MIKAVIFDCFGVLYIDSHTSLVQRFPGVASDLEDLRRQTDHGFLDKKNYLKAILELTGLNYKEIEDIILEEHAINASLVEFIQKELKRRYKIGLLSNIGRGWIENFFDEHQLHDLFDAVVLSGDEGVTKPHPQIYELMAERVGVNPEECIMIDDLPENIAGADAAGMKGIVYGGMWDLKKELSELLK